MEAEPLMNLGIRWLYGVRACDVSLEGSYEVSPGLLPGGVALAMLQCFEWCMRGSLVTDDYVTVRRLR